MSPFRRRLVTTVAVLVAVVVAVMVADAERRLFDLTEDETLTLSRQTREIVSALDRDVDITLFARRSEPGRVEAVSLLDRYRRLDRRIDVDVVDPDEAPGEVSRLGVDPLLGGVVLRSGGRSEIVPFATEGDITGALARLRRSEPSLICAATGHGERAVADDTQAGLGELRRLLERDGYRFDQVDLLAEPAVPPGCEVLLVAAPTGAFSDTLERSLARWVREDGRLLLLTDPATTTTPLLPALADHGLGVERGIVLEGDDGNIVDGDVTAPIVTRYPSANPVGRRLAPTFFPGVQEISVEEDVGTAGLTVSRVAVTSDLSYLERDPLAPEFDPAEDRGGPIVVVGAADRSRVDGADVHRTRIVVAGDIDFATNEFLGDAGNAQLVRQAMAWLTQTEDLVAISPSLPRDRPLRFTDARATYARLLSTGVVPGLFLLAGAAVWALRRSR